MIVMTAVGCLCCVSFILLCSFFVKFVMSVLGRLYMQMKTCIGLVLVALVCMCTVSVSWLEIVGVFVVV